MKYIKNKGLLTLVPKERVKLTSINYSEIHKQINFYESNLYKKCKKILFVFYIHKEENKFESTIVNYIFYDLNDDKNIDIIKSDYSIIVNKVKSGLAHELSGSDTKLLEACTSGANSKTQQKQPFSEKIAKTRSFAYKQKQLKMILNYKDFERYDDLLNDITFKLEKFKYQDIVDLANKYNINIKCKTNKYNLIKSMLDVNNYNDLTTPYAVDNLMFKNIELLKNGKLKEEIGLLDVDFSEFINNIEFEESELYSFLSNLKIIFFVWRREKDLIFFDGIRTKTINKNDILYAKEVWTHTKELFLNSNCIKLENISSRSRYNFVKASDNKFFHIRPHDRKKIDRIKMPNGDKISKFQYWLNKKQVKFDK